MMHGPINIRNSGFCNFDILYAGAFLLLTTGLMGWLGLCSLIWALRSGGWGFFWVRYFFCFLLTIRSLCFRVLVISFWYLSIITSK